MLQAAQVVLRGQQRTIERLGRHQRRTEDELQTALRKFSNLEDRVNTLARREQENRHPLPPFAPKANTIQALAEDLHHREYLPQVPADAIADYFLHQAYMEANRTPFTSRNVGTIAVCLALFVSMYDLWYAKSRPLPTEATSFRIYWTELTSVLTSPIRIAVAPLLEAVSDQQVQEDHVVFKTLCKGFNVPSDPAFLQENFGHVARQLLATKITKDYVSTRANLITSLAVAFALNRVRERSPIWPFRLWEYRGPSLPQCFRDGLRPYQSYLYDRVHQFVCQLAPETPFQPLADEIRRVTDAEPRIRVHYSPTVPVELVPYSMPPKYVIAGTLVNRVGQADPRTAKGLYCPVCAVDVNHPNRQTARPRKANHCVEYCPLVLGVYDPNNPLSNPGPGLTEQQALQVVWNSWFGTRGVPDGFKDLPYGLACRLELNRQPSAPVAPKEEEDDDEPDINDLYFQGPSNIA